MTVDPIKTSENLSATGQVVEVDDAYAWVLTEPQSSCQSCGAKSTCGSSVLAQLFGGKHRLLKVENHLKATLGDQVILSLKKVHFMRHVWMAFGLPLVGLFFFATIGQWCIEMQLLSSDLWVALFGFLGLGIGWGITRSFYQPALPKLKKVFRCI